MILSELFPETRIRCGVELSGWKEAIHLLARILAEDLGLDAEPLKEALSAREKLGITAIGNGVGLPHAKSLEVGSPVGAIIQLRDPLTTATPDDVPVDLFICYMSPTVGADLAPLAQLVRHLRDEMFLRDLRAAKSPAAVHSLLRRHTLS